MKTCFVTRFNLSFFNAGSRQTFFANQATRFADIYSSSCLNLGNYPMHYLFRAPHQLVCGVTCILKWMMNNSLIFRCHMNNLVILPMMDLILLVPCHFPSIRLTEIRFAASIMTLTNQKTIIPLNPNLFRNSNQTGVLSRE